MKRRNGGIAKACLKYGPEAALLKTLSSANVKLLRAGIEGNTKSLVFLMYWKPHAKEILDNLKRNYG